MRFAVIAWLALFAAPASAAENIEAIPLAFESGGETLDGSLIVPRAPVAAAVLVHGGGRAERYVALAELLADEDIAIFTYDKRGVGRSGGTYEDKADIGAQNLAVLAADAAAAFTALQRHKKVAGIPIGIIGLSQAGWVAPVAAQTDGVRFMALWSGVVATTSEEIHYSALAKKDPEIWNMQSAQDIARFVDSVPRRADDVDPRLSIAKLDIPALWLFGEEDASIPVALSVRRLIGLISAGQTNLSYQVFAHEGHNLVDRPTQPAFPAMVTWLKAVAAAK
jgi:pimeloyl-ACP methyl ester carboxylesterase